MTITEREHRTIKSRDHTQLGLTLKADGSNLVGQVKIARDAIDGLGQTGADTGKKLEGTGNSVSALVGRLAEMAGGFSAGALAVKALDMAMSKAADASNYLKDR